MPTPQLIHADPLAQPGIVHGFTTRLGGVSAGPFGTLNLSPKWFDQADAVDKNHALLAEAAGYDRARLYLAHQVHGVRGVHVEDQPAEQVRSEEADFLFTDRPGVTVAVVTADCVPVLLAAGDLPAVAAAHAGWRGLVAGVIGEAVEALGRLGASPGSLRAALGPCIGPCCFEVGPEVVTEFERCFDGVEGIVLGPGADGRSKHHVDLWRAAHVALERAGVTHISAPAACTMCESDRFFSFRRQGPQVGQHLSYIGLQP